MAENNMNVNNFPKVDIRFSSTSPAGPQRARCSITIAGCFTVKGVRLMEGKYGPYLLMPSYKMADTYKSHCYASKEFTDPLRDIVLEAYEREMEQKQAQGQKQPAQQCSEVAETIPGHNAQDDGTAPAQMDGGQNADEEAVPYSAPSGYLSPDYTAVQEMAM